MVSKKALVLYSGGLDSRLVIKLLQEEGYLVEALHFNLPFGCSSCNFNQDFCKNFGKEVKLVVVDICKGKLFMEYLAVLKSPKHGVGAGINPCKDCKLFLLQKAKEYADKKGIDLIATGEVLGQRPMSQTRKALNLIDTELGFKVRRPLIEMGISGRTRTRQMKLAEKYKISYPFSSGGCLLCEKELKKRFKILLKNNLITEKTLPLSLIGRHFFIGGIWFVVGRNEKECQTIEKFKNSINSGRGKPAVYFSFNKSKAIELQKAYQDRKPEIFKEYKI